MDIEIPNENFGTEYEYPDNNSGFDKNTEKMKQYNTIDLSFLRDCEYKNDICNMLSEYSTPEKADSTILAFLEEHCEIIVSADAVQKLAAL